METLYTDRDGDVWKKSCTDCSNYVSNKPLKKSMMSRPVGVSFCSSYSKYLGQGGSESEPFQRYYSMYPNDCPNYRNG